MTNKTEAHAVENVIDEILEARGKQYGVFAVQAEYSVMLKNAIRQHIKYSDMSADKKEALDMILHKIARILNGNSDHVDSWVDIAGYAKLVADNLEGNFR